MSNFFPEIVDGVLVDKNPPAKLFTPPVRTLYESRREEARMGELNNLGRKVVAKDFSDSPHLTDSQTHHTANSM